MFVVVGVWAGAASKPKLTSVPAVKLLAITVAKWEPLLKAKSTTNLPDLSVLRYVNHTGSHLTRCS